jgi:ubiquinone/menaquinone biosynthesis C-methylase UbiE/uncharacterized protein YbaR (Trm112 family)
LLNFLRCPECGSTLNLVPFVQAETITRGEEISEALLSCPSEHWFPVVRGIPRMLPDSLEEHWPTLEPLVPSPAPDALQRFVATRGLQGRNANYDRRTRANFSEEWDHHDLGGKTWGMTLQDRVRWFFVEPLRIPMGALAGKVMLDAGCGNGSQSVAYTKLGLEVIAVDISSGLEHGHAFGKLYEGGDPAKVHFVQGDLQRPPLTPASLDLIHSAGVLHHTPNTKNTFRALRPLLKPGGAFYVWFYKYEPLVTPVVNTMRAVTTRIPSRTFASISRMMAAPFIGFCKTVNALGIRSYTTMSKREAALALMDIFGAPYAHYHSYEEGEGWYRAEGFTEIWGANEGRRGFGVVGRLAPDAQLSEDDLDKTTTPAKALAGDN